MILTNRLLPIAMMLSVAGCSSASSGDDTATGLEIVTVSGAPLSAAAGEALQLKVVSKLADGSTKDLPSGTQVSWSGPTAVTATAPEADPAAEAFPATGAGPVAVTIVNASRTDHADDLSGAVLVLDPGSAPGGSVTVTATVSGASTGTASASITVSASPAGDATRGAALYGMSGANCAECHGATGHGSPDSADGTTYQIDGMPYSFPAPGLNAEDGNAAAEWTPALFTIASRADLDDEGVSLRLPMPNWLTEKNPGTGKTLSTQDFADIFAFLATQKQ